MILVRMQTIAALTRDGIATNPSRTNDGDVPLEAPCDSMGGFARAMVSGDNALPRRSGTGGQLQHETVGLQLRANCSPITIDTSRMRKSKMSRSQPDAS